MTRSPITRSSMTRSHSAGAVAPLMALAKAHERGDATPLPRRFSPLALSALDRLLCAAAVAAALWGAIYWALH